MILNRKLLCPNCKEQHTYTLYFSKSATVKKDYIICLKDIKSQEAIAVTCVYCNTTFPIHRNEFSFYLSRKIKDNDIYDKMVSNFDGLFKIVDSVDITEKARFQKKGIPETRVRFLKKCSFLVAYFDYLTPEIMAEIVEKYCSNQSTPSVYVINPSYKYRKNVWLKRYVIKIFKNPQKFYRYFIEGVCELHYSPPNIINTESE